jgi:hypothetical protein
MHEATGRSELPPAHNQYYMIQVKGHIDYCWSEWLDGLSISYEANGNTVLTGSLADQAALHGLLAKIRDLNLTLLSVNIIEDH